MFYGESVTQNKMQVFVLIPSMRNDLVHHRADTSGSGRTEAPAADGSATVSDAAVIGSLWRNSRANEALFKPGSL